jgi:hypothetical protein
MIETEVARKAVEAMIEEAWAFYAVMTKGHSLSQADIDYEREFFRSEGKLAELNRAFGLLQESINAYQTSL